MAHDSPLQLRWNSSCLAPILPQTGTIPPQLIKGASGARFAKSFKRGRYGARLETSAHIVETLGDIDVLRAVTCAFTALDAIAHELGLVRPHRARRKVLRQPRKPTMRVARVVGAKATGNIDALGARHAVAAPRTGHAIRFLKLSQHTCDGIELLCRHRIRQCAIRQCRVLVHLRGIGHTR